MKRADEGVTLIELLMCLVIAGIVASALTVSFFASTRSIDDSSTRMADTHDSEMASSLFSSDMQSANYVSNGSETTFSFGCGTGPAPVMFVTLGSDGSLPGNELTEVAAYRVLTQNGERQLVRQSCTGSGVVNSTSPTTNVVIAHNLNGTTPTVSCYGSYDITKPIVGCVSTSRVVMAVLTATAQSSPTDSSGFQYVLRAMRRPS